MGAAPEGPKATNFTPFEGKTTRIWMDKINCENKGTRKNPRLALLATPFPFYLSSLRSTTLAVAIQQNTVVLTILGCRSATEGHQKGGGTRGSKSDQLD